MNCFFMLICCIYLTSASCFRIEVSENKKENPADTLKVVHVIFRHGNRTIDPSERFKKDPNYNLTYYPYGLGQLTKTGKIREYNVGKALRERYDGFLSKTYTPDQIEAWTTDYQRTKMSLLLVLHGLFPSNNETEFESGEGWQPIPYNYRPVHADPVLLGTLCPNYETLYNRTIEIDMRTELSQYEQYFNELSSYTGKNIRNYMDVYYLYFALSTESEYNLELPSWTKKYWPTNITEMAIKEYDVAMHNLTMQQMAVGYFFENLLKTTNETLKHKSSTKMYLYSAHESNVAHLLKALDIFEPHVPTYGAHLIFEVHEISGHNYVKVFYQNKLDGEPELQKLPGCKCVGLACPHCEGCCPLEIFQNITGYYISNNPNLCTDIQPIKLP